MRSCPSEVRLLRLAMAPDSAGDIATHVGTCLRCQHEIAELRTAIAGIGLATFPAQAVTACLPDDAIGALAEGGQGSAIEVAHLATCGSCAERLASVSRILAHEDVADVARSVRAPGGAAWRRGWLAGASAVAAAALMIVVVRTARHPEPEAALREEPMALIATPRPVQPVGAVERVETLSWRSVPGATRYRITLFTQDGVTAWTEGTADTALTLPLGVRLAPNAVYYWKVEARTDWDRWSSSELIEVRIGGPR